MEVATTIRLALIYGHLLLCVFALHAVLHTDYLVLRNRLVAQHLPGLHRQLTWLLLGLWVSGSSVAAMDLHFDLAALGAHPKIIVKLCTVSVLTLNAVLLRMWCFPRLEDGRPLGHGEHRALLAIGAVSTTSWLMAAFFGIARPLGQWPLWKCLALYGAGLGGALLAAFVLAAVMPRRGVGYSSCPAAAQPPAAATKQLAAATRLNRQRSGSHARSP